MREDSNTVELLRHRFRNGDPAMVMRHSARDALQASVGAKPDAEWIDDALIVISELVQNVSQHTSSPGELIVRLEGATVLIEVGDSSTSVPQVRHPGPDRPGGRGLALVAAISQHWGVRECLDGKIVWARLPRH